MNTLTPHQKTLLFLDLCPLSPAQKRKLLAVFPAPGEILRKLAAESPRLPALIGQTAFEEMRRRCNADFFLKALRRLEQDQTSFVCLKDPEYPISLLSLPDPPLVLYLSGDPALLKAPKISLVGSRRCSVEDYRRVKDIAFTLAKAGFCVVSGLAEGCDAAAHQGALEAGGRTLAVTANGFESVYPRSNTDLFRRIRRQGLLLCENPPGFRPQGYHFVLRNRIVAALSHAVVIAMAGAKSGTFSTARFALECGRPVFARSADGPDYAGCRALIRENGCIGFRESEDLLKKLPEFSLPPNLLDQLTDRDLASALAPPNFWREVKLTDRPDPDRAAVSADPPSPSGGSDQTGSGGADQDPPKEARNSAPSAGPPPPSRSEPGKGAGRPAGQADRTVSLTPDDREKRSRPGPSPETGSLPGRGARKPLGPEPGQPPSTELGSLDRADESVRRRLLAALSREGKRADELLGEFERTALFEALFDLEFEGLIVRQGGIYLPARPKKR